MQIDDQTRKAVESLGDLLKADPRAKLCETTPSFIVGLTYVGTACLTTIDEPAELVKGLEQEALARILLALLIPREASATAEPETSTDLPGYL